MKKAQRNEKSASGQKLQSYFRLAKLFFLPVRPCHERQSTNFVAVANRKHFYKFFLMKIFATNCKFAIGLLEFVMQVYRSMPGLRRNSH